MGEEQFVVLPLKAAYTFGAAHGLGKEVEQIRTMEIEWDLSYTSSLRRGYIVELFSERGIFESFKAEYWSVGNTPAGVSKTKSWLRIKQRYEDFLQTGGEQKIETIEEEAEEQAFAAESDLRDFLAKNPNCIERGLRLHVSDDQNGVEFPIDGGNGRVDLLLVDPDERFVVVELKLGRGRERTLGQLLYYMGWVDQHLPNSPCRGIIIAKDIPDDLVLAVKRAPGVSLCRYKLSVSIESLG
jgi:hypothetical protein